MENSKTKKLLNHAVEIAYNQGRRLTVPLVGFPGINLTGSTIKLAQQNYEEHYKVIKALVEKFEPDAVFPLMDLSVEANALGAYTIFPKEESATVVKDIFCLEIIESANKINIQYDTRLLGYAETMKLMRSGLPKNILRGAYVTGPYTLAGLLMGAEEVALATIMKPDELSKVIKIATAKIHDYIELLVSAGAQMICILEPSAVMLGPDQFEQFSGKFVRQIVDSFLYTDVGIIYHICGNTMHLLEKMCDTGINALSLDACEAGVDLSEAAKRINRDVIIIGNINPVGKLLYGQLNEVAKETCQLLDQMGSYPNYVLSTGCDLPQETPIENIAMFMKVGKEYRIEKSYH